MTTNMNATFTISREGFDDDSVIAEYFTANGEWVEFKDSEHKVTSAYPAHAVSRIKRVGLEASAAEAETSA